jgi:hypothetical protein
MKAGDFVIWDSCKVHSSTEFTKDSPKEEYRLQVFVSMLPKIQDEQLYEAEMERRIKDFAEGRTSKHTADVLRYFDLVPRVSSTATFQPSIPYRGMTEDEEKLHGLRRLFDSLNDF